MTETVRIAEELVRSVDGPAWHGESLMEMLEGVPAEVANAKPVADGHSVHELVLHITTWIRLASAGLRGRALPSGPFPENWLAALQGEDGWQVAIARLQESCSELADLVRRLDPKHLDNTVPGRDYDMAFLLNGVVQHAAYHGGQIAITLKLARV